MRISVRFLCVDIPVGMGNGDITLSEGATVSDAVAAVVALGDIQMPTAEIMKSLFLVNDQSAQPDSILRDGDNLSVVRPLAGG